MVVVCQYHMCVIFDIDKEVRIKISLPSLNLVIRFCFKCLSGEHILYEVFSESLLHLISNLMELIS